MSSVMSDQFLVISPQCQFPVSGIQYSVPPRMSFSPDDSHKRQIKRAKHAEVPSWEGQGVGFGRCRNDNRLKNPPLTPPRRGIFKRFALRLTRMRRFGVFCSQAQAHFSRYLIGKSILNAEPPRSQSFAEFSKKISSLRPLRLRVKK